MHTDTQSLVTEFFTGLGIQLDGVTVEQSKDDVNIAIQTSDSPLIIGMHGKSIEAFQHLLSRMLEQYVGRHAHIHLEVNDYMKQKDERLHRFLDSKIEFATSTGKSIRIPNLTSYERKKAHSYIADRKITGLGTQSEGEGTERALVLSYTGALIAAPRPHAAPVASSTSRMDDLSEDGVGI